MLFIDNVFGYVSRCLFMWHHDTNDATVVCEKASQTQSKDCHDNQYAVTTSSSDVNFVTTR